MFSSKQSTYSHHPGCQNNYYSIHFPHSQPLSAECAGSRHGRVCYPTYILRWTRLRVLQTIWIEAENSFSLLSALSKAVWFTIREENGRGSFGNIKYFRASGLRPIDGREARRGWGRRTESEKNEEGEERMIWNSISSWFQCSFHYIFMWWGVCVQPVIIHITYHFHFNCTRPREGGLVSIILIIHKSKYSRFSNDLLERSLLLDECIYVCKRVWNKTDSFISRECVCVSMCVRVSVYGLHVCPCVSV